MNDNAELCVKCGVKRNVGTDYCQVCGTRTIEGMRVCKKCGAKLMQAMSTAQLKKTAITKGKSILGTIILIIGLIFLIGAAANLIIGLADDNVYSSMSSMSSFGYLSVIGGFLTGLGIRFRKKK